MGLKVFISHGAGKDECVEEALELLVPELEHRGYEVFVDVKSLRSGDVWAEQLYMELFRCDAAVVLLGPHTVADSEWVRRETEILMARHVMRSLPHVLPALLGGAGTREARSKGYGPLLRLQTKIHDRAENPNPRPGQAATVQEVVEWLLREFAHVGHVSSDEYVFEWADRIADYIDSASERSHKRVVKTAERLGLQGGDLQQIAARIGSHLLLAFRLLAAASQGVVLAQALAELQPALRTSSLKQLAEQLKPGWVDADAARCFLPEQTQEGPRGRVIIFPAYDAWMADHHVQRALFVKPMSWRGAALEDEPDLALSDESLADWLYDACLSSLAGVFRAPPWDKELKTVRHDERVTQYLVVSREDYALDVISEVARRLQARWPWLGFVILTPEGLPDPKELEANGLTDAIRVTPAPDEATQAAAFTMVKSIDELLEQCA
ncbi:toll/interleukin-1 receptor domain-containing protein [Streptomyces sp. S.PNR 29]|uniref:toll/interleukin-1 receptor domain-containing protein n=1 Tax=Streptomyces sp. S.PNR 29 TaxID=2973805 RepID=UPI0025B0021B|nr:toll/interleukin-1 receptor domain-containing protein [Streptomyces sp. S.PNR 29]